MGSLSDARVASDLQQSLRRRGIERQIMLDHLLELAVLERFLRCDQLTTDFEDAFDNGFGALLVGGANLGCPLRASFDNSFAVAGLLGGTLGHKLSSSRPA